ncbi:hypothetical protein V8D89_001526 [Ganoderma adspersum]
MVDPPLFPPPAMPLLSLGERVLVARTSNTELVAGQGNLLIGVFVGIVLYGLSVHQACRYIRSFPTDAAYIRLLVVLVMILETLDVVATMHTSFYNLVLNFSDPKILKQIVWSEAVHPAIGASIVLVSQIFFIRRVSLIGPRQRITGTLVAVSLIAGLGFAAASTAISFTREHSKGTTISQLSGAALAIAALADSALTVALIQAFRWQRAAEPREIESIIDVIQLYVINSGLATGTFTLIAFILALSLPQSGLVYSVFFIISVRLYANSLLAVLNSRELRGMEFLLSAPASKFASGSVTLQLEGAQFADKSALWNVPRPRREKPQFTNPWNTAPEDTKETGSYFN